MAGENLSKQNRKNMSMKTRLDNTRKTVFEILACSMYLALLEVILGFEMHTSHSKVNRPQALKVSGLIYTRISFSPTRP